MPEKLDITDGSPRSILLLGAISPEAVFRKVHAASPGPLVEVQLTVSGVEVPFTPIVDRMWEEALRIAREDLHKKAFEMVSAAGLADLAAAVQDARWKLLEKFEAAGIELELPED